MSSKAFLVTLICVFVIVVGICALSLPAVHNVLKGLLELIGNGIAKLGGALSMSLWVPLSVGVMAGELWDDVEVVLDDWTELHDPVVDDRFLDIECQVIDLLDELESPLVKRATTITEALVEHYSVTGPGWTMALRGENVYLNAAA